MQPPRRETAEEVARAPQRRRAEREDGRRHPGSVVADGAGGGLRVQLVRVVEDSRLGRSGCLPVVVGGDRVQELGAHRGVETPRPLLHEPEPEVDVPEQPPLLRLTERGAALELPRPAHVVQKRGREQEIATEPRVQLRRLAAQRRDADRVLEQAAGVAVVTLGPCGREGPVGGSDQGVAEDGRDGGREPGMCDLAREEVEKAVELVRVAAESRRQLGRVGLGGRLDRSYLHLQPAAEPLHATEDTDGVARREASVEELDVVPDARLDRPLASTSSSAR